MYGAFTLARNSASSPNLQFVKPCTSAFDWFKQESDQTWVRFLLNGTLIMALSQRLEFRQSQSLVMTPQLMQAIKLLQLSNLDLAAFVEDELERNPLLERASDGSEPAPGEPASERAEFSDRGEPGSEAGDGASDGFDLPDRGAGGG